MFGLELIVGGVLFWLLFVALLVLCEISAVNETHWGFLWLVLFGIILWWGFDTNLLKWMYNNVGTLLIYAGVYLALGVVWGFAKWWFHLKNARDRLDIRNGIAAYKTDYNNKQASTNPFNGTFTEWLEDKGLIPLAKNNKEKISVWMFWWPFSMFWTMLEDVLRRMYEWIIEHYIFIFDRINKVVFGDLNK